MQTCKTIFPNLLLAAVALYGISCKKESATKTQIQTNQEKILGKWNLVSEVVNNYYNGSSHITTYNFQAGDYMDFKAGGNVTEHKSGSPFTYQYGFINESTIWLLVPDKKYNLGSLTASDLQMATKEVTGTDYYESTLNLKR